MTPIITAIVTTIPSGLVVLLGVLFLLYFILVKNINPFIATILKESGDAWFLEL